MSSKKRKSINTTVEKDGKPPVAKKIKTQEISVAQEAPVMTAEQVKNKRIMTLYAQEKSQSFSMALPAGQYYVGDPSYTCPGSLWYEVIQEATDYLTIEPQIFMNHLLFCHSTAEGDGGWKNKLGSEQFGVDSGTFGIMPMELVWKMNKDFSFSKQLITNAFRLGAVIDFKTPFTVTAAHGEFKFGDKVWIDTRTPDDF